MPSLKHPPKSERTNSSRHPKSERTNSSRHPKSEETKPSKPSFVKGEPIKLVGGRHQGKLAWVDQAKEVQVNDNRVYIIVMDKEKGERSTWTSPSNISINHEHNPRNYAEAIIQQKPKLDQMINKITNELAKFDLDGETVDGLVEYFNYKLYAAANLKWNLKPKF